MTLSGDERRLCLLVEAVADADAMARVEAALSAARPPAIVIEPGVGRALAAADARPIVALAQGMDVAALIQDDAELAQALGADGVHLAWRKDIVGAYEAARARLGRSAIVGADAGRSRHDAMTLGELGADYVAFGIPSHVGDRDTASARRRDLVQWWAEIFEPPCMAFDVQTAEEAADLAAAGADFIAVRLPDNLPPSDLARWLDRFASAVSGPAAVA